MKQRWLTVAVLLLCAAAVEAQDRKPTTPPKNPPAAARSANSGAPATANPATKPALPAAALEKASYAIGYDLATSLRTDGADINLDALTRGLQDSWSGNKPAYAQPDMQAAVEAFQKEVAARAQARFRQLTEKHKREGATHLAQNKAKKGVTTLPSGLQYEVLKSGKGKTPTEADKVRVHYHGTLLDGTVFDSTQNGDPIEIEVKETITAWGEALGKMKVGDKWRLTVPPNLAYGEQGYGPIPPSATLVFEIELLDVGAATVQQSARPKTVK